VSAIPERSERTAAPERATSPARRSRRLGAALQAGVSLVALGAVVWWATRQDAPALPRTREDVLTVVGAIAIYALVTAVRAERWHRICSRSGVPVDRGDTYRLTTVGYMGNNVLPARSGDVMRAFLLAPLARTRKRRVLGTVVAERLLDAVALGVVFAVVAVGVLGRVDLPPGRTLLVVGVAVLGMAGAALAAVVAVRRADALRRARALVRPFAAPTRDLASGHGLGLLAFSLALWTLEAAVYLVVGHAVGVELGLLEAVYVVALTNLFALVPAAPGYVGTFDAAVLFAVGSLGTRGSDALSYLVLLRFVLFVPITLVGLAFFVARYGGWKRYRAARLETGASA
jgi:glycosyltransferase 2 family protein